MLSMMFEHLAMLDFFKDIPYVHIYLNVYDLISNITTTIFIRRPKHLNGDVDSDYRHRKSVACVPRYSMNLQCCYIHFGHGVVEGECSTLIVMPFSLTMWHSTRPWIVTWPPVSCPTPSTKRPRTTPTAMQPGLQGGWQRSDCNVLRH